MTAVRRRLAMPNLVRLDLLLAVALGAELELEALSHGGGSAYRTTLTVAASALLVAPIAVRRRWPAGALIFSATVLAAQQLLGGYLRTSNGVSAMLTLGVLAYAAGAWLELRAGLASLVATAALFSGFNFGPGSGSSGGIGADVFVVAVALIVPWLVGRIARARSSRAAAFRELAAKAAERRAESERAAVEGERLRISSELHDIIAHSVSAMVIQAAGARRLLRSDPRRARESILSVERSGRETLGDLRRLLGVLRSDDDPRGTAPPPKVR
jgi:signal transduction histidine kinase